MSKEEVSLVKANNDNIIGLLDQAKSKIVIAKPGYFVGEVEKLLEVIKNKNVKCKIFYEPGDHSERFGFGERKALDILKENCSYFEMALAEQIRMAILVVDEKTLLYAPDINFMDADSSKASFPNGVLGNSYFTKMVIDEISLIENGNASNGFAADVISFPSGEIINKGKDEIVEQLNEDIHKLQLNPPVDPTNLQRVNLYRNNYKIVKLCVYGVKIRDKKINLKPFLRMLSNVNERLLSSWMVFSKEDVEKLEDTRIFDKEKEKIIKKYLTDAGRYGYILFNNDKKEFDCSINKLVMEYREFLKGEATDSNRFQKEFKKNEQKEDLGSILEASKQELIKYLDDISKSDSSFFNALLNMDRKLKRKYSENEITKEDARKEFIEDFVENKLTFPRKEETVDNIKIKVDYYDVSDELIEDEEFREKIEHRKCEEIRHYSEGYERL